MKAKYRIILGSLCLLIVFLFVGCESSEPIKEEKPKETKKEAKKPEEQTEEQKRLNDLVNKKSLEEQEREVFINHLIKSAQNKVAQHQYNSAKAFLDRALEVDPKNKKARELRDEVGSYLGESNASNKTLLTQYEEEIRVKVEQAKLETRNHFRSGNKHLQDKEYDKAIHSFESALEIIKWAPYELNMVALRKQAEEKIKAAKRGKEKALARERLARMREAQAEAERLEAEEQSRRRLQVQLLLKRATEYYAEKRFDKAENLLSQVLEIDPANKVARKMRDEIGEARHAHIAEKTLQNRIEGWKTFIEEMQEAKIPYSSQLLYPDPDFWHNRVNKRQKATQIGNSIGAKETSNAEREIIEKLESTRITLNFTETPFEDVIRFIQANAEINIVVDPKVIQNFQIEGTRVTLNVRDLKLKSALNILLQFHNLVYLFRNDVLFITSKESQLAKGKTVTVLHDIRDLTGQIKDFPGPRVRLLEANEGGSAGSVFEDQAPGGGAVLTGEKLTELIRSSIAPDSWDNEEISIAETSGHLLVVNTETIQDEIRKFLTDMRRFSGLMVAVETRFLTVTDDFLEDLGIEWRGIGNDNLNQNNQNRAVITSNPSLVQTGQQEPIDNQGGANNSPFPAAGLFFQETRGTQTIDARARTQHVDDVGFGNFRQTNSGGLSAQLATLDDLQLSVVLEAVKKTSRTEVLAAPRITTFNTQRAHITVVTQRSYVQDFNVEVAQSAYIADPVIGTIQDGVVLDVKPTISNDRKYITLELRPTIAELIGGQFGTLNTSLGGVDQVTIEIPELQLQAVETTVRVPDGGTVLLSGFKDIISVDRKQDVPVLGDIPLIGFFFSRRTKVDEKRQTLIVVKAKVIDLTEEEEKAVGLSR